VPLLIAINQPIHYIIQKRIFSIVGHDLLLRGCIAFFAVTVMLTLVVPLLQTYKNVPVCFQKIYNID